MIMGPIMRSPCRSRASGNPGFWRNWAPAFAGATAIRYLVEDVGVHREDAGVDRAVDALGLVVLGRRAEGDEQRQEVLVGRMCPGAVRRTRAVVGERVELVRLEPLAYPVGKFL